MEVGMGEGMWVKLQLGILGLWMLTNWYWSCFLMQVVQIDSVTQHKQVSEPRRSTLSYTGKICGVCM